MKGVIFCLIFTILLNATFSQNPGIEWTEEDFGIIREKVEYIIQEKKDAFSELKGRHDSSFSKSYKNFKPSANKFLRLGFHDCLTYKKGAPMDGINGCDGCLNSKFIGKNFLTYFKNELGRKPTYDELRFTSNNGLLSTADILEEVYNFNGFPKKTRQLPGVSMKEKGYSRADLWAFATMVAVEHGIENNNKGCTGDRGCGHIRAGKADCEITMPREFRFKFGRKDCVPEEGDENLGRPFLTSRDEIHPDSNGNGPITVKFYKDNFGLTARESIVLTGGAHSMGRLNPSNSQLKYPWTESQTTLFNNQNLRNYASMPQYYTVCSKNKWVAIGNSTGQPAETGYQIRKRNALDNGDGPYLFHRIYNRCKVSCETSPDDKCCKGVKNPQGCLPECQKNFHRFESALLAEVGFYRNFDVNATNGKPICDAMNKKQTKVTLCDKEEYDPEGEKLFEIVDDYAKSQTKFINDFMPTLEKMLQNGYADDELKPFGMVIGITQTAPIEGALNALFSNVT